MADKQPLTRKDLLDALKALPTEERVNEIVLEVSDIVLKGVEALLQEMRDEMNSRFDKLESGHGDLQRQIDNLKHDVPARKEFDELKRKVDRYHPAN